MSRYTLTSSTELMQNYQQVTVMAPDKQFVALQRPDGGALLFSIGDEGSFNVTVESAGSRHGWTTVPLSGDHPDATCGHFAVAQRPDLSIAVAMVLRQSVGGHPNDALYVGSFAADALADVTPPAWTALPYDDPGSPRGRLEIAGVFLSEASDGEYLIADAVRDPDSATGEISRYFLDPAKADGHAWHPHDVPVDIESGRYASVLGRKADATIDGMYVSGQIDGKPQIIYTPLFNELRPDRHPLTDYLALTASGDIPADAVAACRNADGSSDLYAAARGVLYRFASTNQANGSVAAVATSSPLFTGMRDLFAFASDGLVTVWGRNADNATFSTSCAVAHLGEPAAWSVPLPILAGVEQVSPFVNRANSANTLVAHTGEGHLRMGTKSPVTGAWAWREVTLAPAHATAPARSFNSFTTNVHVRDADHSPAAGIAIAVSSPTVTSVFINHLYYVVGPTPIHVPTDVMGTLTIVEAVPRLSGARWTLAVVDDPAGAAEVNPMDKAFRKATDLQSPEALRHATIPTYVGGKRGTPRNLVRDGVDDATLRQVAHLNQQCALVYADPAKKPSPAHLQAMADAEVHAFAVPADTPRVDAGDLFQFLETQPRASAPRVAGLAEAAGLAAGETVWQMIVRWFEDAWEFVVKIGEAVFRCVLAVIEDVVSAVRWVFDKIVAGIEDLISFLQYLFEWDDFQRTKDVLLNVARVSLEHQVGNIAALRASFDAGVDDVIAAMDAWSHADAFSGLGDAGGGRLSSQGTASGPDAPGGLMSHHLQGNIHAASGADPSGAAPSASLLGALEQAIASEKEVLGTASTRLQHLMQEAPHLSLGDILKAVVGILGDAVVRSAQVVVDALLDVLEVAMADAVAALFDPVHIPVISDILNAIGVPDVSLMDILCWVAAVPVTIGYKLVRAVEGKDAVAPFPAGAETTFLSETQDYAALLAAFAPAPHADRMLVASGDGPIVMSPVAREAVFISLHSAAGVCGWVSAFLDAFESLIPVREVPKALSRACVAAAIVGGLSRAIANVLVPKFALEGEKINGYSKAFTVLFLSNKIIFGLLGLKQDVDPTDYRAVSAGVDAVLVLPALIITCVHFNQLSGKDAGDERSIAILDETSFMATYVGRVLYTLVVTGVFDSNEEVKAGVAAAMGVTQVIHGVLQFTEAAIEGVG